jgi:alpha-beta hydrolase superfamily lysophospholipase
MHRWLVILGLAIPATLGAQAPTREAFALVSADGDTVAVERWVRWGDRTEALITRDGHPWFHLIAETDPESGTERLAFTSYDPAPEGVAGVSFSHEVVVRDTVATVRDAITGEITDRLVVPVGTIPFLPASLALVERRLMRDPVLRSHRDALTQLPVLAVGPTGARLDTLQFVVTSSGRDSLWSHLRWHDLVVAHRPDGSVVGARSLDASPALAYRPLPAAIVAQPWPPRPRNYLPGREATYRVEEVALTLPGGLRLGGSFTIPGDRPGPHPALLLLSGSGAQDRDATMMSGYRPLREIAEALAVVGVATVRFDDRGIGASTGDYAESTIADLADDARAAVAWLRRQSEVRSDAVGMLGHSEGALVALRAAANGADPAALVLLSGSARTGREIVAAQQRYGAERLVRDSVGPEREVLADSLVREAARAIDVLAGDSRALRYFLQFDPGRAARQLAVPALIVHGVSDRQVPVSQAYELADALRRRGASVSLQLFDDVDHLLLDDPVGDPALYLTLPSRQLPRAVLAAITAWVRTALGS